MEATRLPGKPLAEILRPCPRSDEPLEPQAVRPVRGDRFVDGALRVLGPGEQQDVTGTGMDADTKPKLMGKSAAK